MAYQRQSGVYALIENRPEHKLFGLPWYVGQSVCLKSRWNSHVRKSTSRKDHKSNIIKAHLEQGVPVKFVPLVICEEKDLDYYETQLIRIYRNTVVNHSAGGKREDCVAAVNASNRKGGYKIAAAASVNSDYANEIRSNNGKNSGGWQSALRASLTSSKTKQANQNKVMAMASLNKLARINKWHEELKSNGLPLDSVVPRNMNLTYFHGVVCVKHPDLLGLRVTKQGTCQACTAEATALRNKKLRSNS